MIHQVLNTNTQITQAPATHTHLTPPSLIKQYVVQCTVEAADGLVSGKNTEYYTYYSFK